MLMCRGGKLQRHDVTATVVLSSAKNGTPQIGVIVTLLVNPLCKLLINPTGVPH